MVHMIENQWVAAVYNNNWYILVSKIQEVNRNDGDVHLTFLERMNTKGGDSETQHRWPKHNF